MKPQTPVPSSTDAFGGIEGSLMPRTAYGVSPGRTIPSSRARASSTAGWASALIFRDKSSRTARASIRSTCSVRSCSFWRR